MKSRVLAVITIFSTGCAVGELPSPVTETVRADEPEVVEEMFPEVPFDYVAPAALEFRITPIDRGLFDGPVDAPASFVVDLQDGKGAFEAEIGPGVFAVSGFDDASKVFDGTSADDVDGATGEVTDGPFFNPTRGRFEFRVAYDGAWSVVAQRVTEGSAPAIDTVASPSEVGSWFDEAFATDQVFEAIYEHGGPFITERGVLFVAPTTAGAPAPFVRGSWNGFAPVQLRDVSTGFAALYVEVGPGEHTYTFFDPGTQTTGFDQTNRFVTRAVDGFESVLAPEGPRTVWVKDIFSPELGTSRDAYVRLPASYGSGEGTREYATMYVHDGLVSITDGQFDEVADHIGSLSASLETITVFIAPPSSSLAQTMSSTMQPADAYVDFVADTLVPYVETTFRARSTRRARGTSGASFGGVASFWTAVRHAETFGYTAGISAPLVESELLVVTELAAHGCQDVVYRVAASADEPGALATNMRDVLGWMGCDFDYVTDTARDEWTTYGDRFGETLVDFAHVHAF